MSSSALNAVTDFGDLALMLPLAAVVLLWLIGVRAKSSALWWIAALMLCGGGTALLKIYFFACPPTPDLHSPSGHASLSTLVYGALGLIIARETQGWRTIMVLGAALTAMLAIAASRIALNAHSLVEVLLGLAIGLMALGLFASGYLRHRPLQARLPALLLVVALAATTLHGSNLRAEELLHALSDYLQVGAVGCAKALLPT
jgi:membrane-associated phospholipid phosphatase